jgi:hypothetical protein
LEHGFASGPTKESRVGHADNYRTIGRNTKTFAASSSEYAQRSKRDLSANVENLRKNYDRRDKQQSDESRVAWSVLRLIATKGTGL